MELICRRVRIRSRMEKTMETLRKRWNLGKRKGKNEKFMEEKEMTETNQ
jgi:hypothetical protein